MSTTHPDRVALSDLHCPLVTVETLVDLYDFFLLDAYGVLVHDTGAIHGALEFLDVIKYAKKDFLVVTNDASRLPETAAQRFKDFGLGVEAGQVLTSGSLLTPFFASRGLSGALCMVLGPEDSFEYVRQAGGQPIAPSADASFDALVVCDDAGYPFLETMDMVLSNLCHHYDRGESPVLILPNPDVIYPKGASSYGFTSGGAALLLEAAVAQRYPHERAGFARLGKPFGPMFREAKRVAQNDSLIMIGDQIETDITGARSVGIDAALVDTGIAKWESTMVEPARAPTYRLTGLG
jgi:HAD superfamily hydrolase (TIGR01450 family)